MSGEKYILVDFENIQPANLDRLRNQGFTLRIFLGSAQERLPLKIVNSLQVFGTALEYIQTRGIGPNALDFHIAYFLGRQALLTPDAQFFVISRDTGFDPLLQHLRGQGICCRRVTSVDEVSHDYERVQAVQSLSARELIHKVVDALTKRVSTRPRTIKTLRSAVNAMYGKKLQAQQLDGVVLELKQRGVISELTDRLHYNLPLPADGIATPTGPSGETTLV